MSFNRMFRRDKPSSFNPARNDYNQAFFKALIGKHIESMKDIRLTMVNHGA